MNIEKASLKLILFPNIIQLELVFCSFIISNIKLTLLFISIFIFFNIIILLIIYFKISDRKKCITLDEEVFSPKTGIAEDYEKQGALFDAGIP